MDVSFWTIASRMKLPDHCFGQRLLHGMRIYNTTPDTFQWLIASRALPDPVCIWSLGLVGGGSDYAGNWVRVGLADTVPTSSAEMDATVNFLPEFGTSAFAPPRISVPTDSGINYNVAIRKGIVTGGKKLVIEGNLSSYGTTLVVSVFIIAAALPTKVPGWPGAWPAG